MFSLQIVCIGDHVTGPVYVADPTRPAITNPKYLLHQNPNRSVVMAS